MCFWPGFYPTGYIPEKTYPCTVSVLQPWKFCPRKMHTLCQMRVCTNGCRDRNGLWHQWMGQTQERHLLSHPTMCLPLWSLQRRPMSAEQPMGEHHHLEMMPLQPQGAFQPKPSPAMPLPSSMFPIPWPASVFHPSQWPFYRACKKPSSYAVAGEKMPEINLGTDPKSDWSIIYSSQWKIAVLRTAAELPPSSTVPGLLQAPCT